MAVIKLTQEVVNQLKLEEGKKSAEIVDNQRTGLYVKLTASSSVYYFRYKNDQGKTAHQKLSRTDEMSLSDARSRVQHLKSEIASGEQIKVKKTIPTFAEFFLDQYLPYAKSRKRSWNKDESLFRCHLREEFGKTRLDSINRGKAQVFHIIYLLHLPLCACLHLEKCEHQDHICIAQTYPSELG